MQLSYLLIIVVSLVIGGFASIFVKSRLSKYSKVGSASGFTGAQMAHAMLSANGLNNVQVQRGPEGADHFDPRDNSISLSPSVYDVCSVTAIATAVHEVGHACQFAQGYAPMRFRTALVPVVNFTQNTWFIVLMIGILLNMIGFVDVAIIFYAFAVLFQVVTLPVEFNASRRGLAYLDSCGIVSDERAGTKSVLTACALTYVAAALVSVVQLLYLLQFRDR